MGCDIHVWIEDFEDGWEYGGVVYEERGWKLRVWEDYTWDDRSYNQFSQLGYHWRVGAENRHEAVAELRGLPEDMSAPLAAEMKDNSDLHSHSWLTLKECEKYAKDHAWVSPSFSEFMDWWRAHTRFHVTSQKTRIVFGFDN